jgi:hypothetical protein
VSKEGIFLKAKWDFEVFLVFKVMWLVAISICLPCVHLYKVVVSIKMKESADSIFGFVSLSREWIQEIKCMTMVYFKHGSFLTCT